MKQYKVYDKENNEHRTYVQVSHEEYEALPRYEKRELFINGKGVILVKTI